MMRTETCFGLADFEFVSPSDDTTKRSRFLKRSAYIMKSSQSVVRHTLYTSISAAHRRPSRCVCTNPSMMMMIELDTEYGFRHDLWVLVRDLSCQAVVVFVPVNIREFEKVLK